MEQLVPSLEPPWPVWLAIALVILGAALLANSAHWIIQAGAGIADALGVSRGLVGLTIVAAGTSAPEFAVTLSAGLRGHGDIAVGNVVGSNIFNLGFILGSVALVAPLTTDKVIVWRDGTTLVASTLLFLAFIVPDLTLSRGEGMLLLTALAAYLGLVASRARLSTATAPEGRGVGEQAGGRAARGHAGRLLAGLVLLALSAHVLTEGARSIASWVGVSDWVIAVTLLAAGTSLPELATSVVAARKGYYAMSLGNIIGSDILNVLGVMGLTGTLYAARVDESAVPSLAALSVMALVTVLFMRSGWTLSRREGGLLVAIGIARWLLDFGSIAGT